MDAWTMVLAVALYLAAISLFSVGLGKVLRRVARRYPKV